VPVGPARLTQLVGLSRAKELVYTGRPIGGAEAVALGLATRVVPADEAEAAALELARTLTTQSPTGLRTLKQMFRDLEGTTARIAHENELLVDFQRHGAGLPQG
jgi:enoyl-CoA hydratase/carnithine racemase